MESPDIHKLIPHLWWCLLGKYWISCEWFLVPTRLSSIEIFLCGVYWDLRAYWHGKGWNFPAGSYPGSPGLANVRLSKSKNWRIASNRFLQYISQNQMVDCDLVIVGFLLRPIFSNTVTKAFISERETSRQLCTLAPGERFGWLRTYSFA